MIYLGPLQIGLAEIYGMPLNGLGQDGLPHDISGAPSAKGLAEIYNVPLIGLGQDDLEWLAEI
jgi:hypothetical protein